MTKDNKSKSYKFQKNQFGMNLLIVDTDKEVEMIERLLNQDDGFWHECDDCGEFHPIKNKWWNKK